MMRTLNYSSPPKRSRRQRPLTAAATFFIADHSANAWLPAIASGGSPLAATTEHLRNPLLHGKAGGDRCTLDPAASPFGPVAARRTGFTATILPRRVSR